MAPHTEEYYTNADATIRLLSHPDEEWRGRTVDVAYFQITAGTSPVHIWNYARSKGTPAMSNPAQEQQLDDLQSGNAGGAPFDDTAESNQQVSLQLLLNEERFEDTYYQFRSMSEIGDIQVKYSGRKGFEDVSETGYVLVDGRVSTVSRESSTRNGTHPSVEITFRDIRPLGQTIALDTSEFAPSGRQRGGPGVSRALQAEGIGRDEDQPAFNIRIYNGMVGGRQVRPSFDNVPSSISGFDQFVLRQDTTFPGVPSRYVQGSEYSAPVLVTDSRKEGRAVYLWAPGDSPRYREVGPTSEAIDTIQTNTVDE